MGVHSRLAFSQQRDNSQQSRWSMRQRSSTSATSTIGMARARSTSSSSETSCTLLAWTSPRRLALPRDRLTRRARSSPSMTMSSRRSRPLWPPPTPREAMLAELDNILCNLGDEVPKEDVQKLFAELCDPED